MNRSFDVSSCKRHNIYLLEKGIDASGVIIRMNYNSAFIFVKPKRTVEESFYYFITNSKVHLISDSSAFGFVFRCHFQKKEQKSPYFYLDINGKSRDVIHIALKCLLVNDLKETSPMVMTQ